jgi:hypothetical protein
MTSESDLAPVFELERELKVTSIEIMTPRPAECLHCYVYRMLEFGCRGLRWAVRYRDMKAPRATALHHRLMSKGAGCDCEIFMNGWTLRYEHQLWDPESQEYEYPEELPACRGVRAGSIQPCGLWMVRPRGLWW